MLPARQCFQPAQVAIGNRDLWLEIRHKLLLCDGLLQHFDAGPVRLGADGTWLGLVTGAGQQHTQRIELYWLEQGAQQVNLAVLETHALDNLQQARITRTDYNQMACQTALAQLAGQLDRSEE